MFKVKINVEEFASVFQVYTVIIIMVDHNHAFLQRKSLCPPKLKTRSISGMAHNVFIFRYRPILSTDLQIVLM